MASYRFELCFFEGVSPFPAGHSRGVIDPGTRKLLLAVTGAIFLRVNRTDLLSITESLSSLPFVCACILLCLFRSFLSSVLIDLYPKLFRLSYVNPLTCRGRFEGPQVHDRPLQFTSLSHVNVVCVCAFCSASVCHGRLQGSLPTAASSCFKITSRLMSLSAPLGSLYAWRK